MKVTSKTCLYKFYKHLQTEKNFSHCTYVLKRKAYLRHDITYCYRCNYTSTILTHITGI